MCDNFRVLGTHMRKVHEKHSLIFERTNVPWCVTCLKYLFTLPRAFCHYRSSPKCYTCRLDNFDVLSADEIEENQRACQQARRHLKSSGYNEIKAEHGALPGFEPRIKAAIDLKIKRIRCTD